MNPNSVVSRWTSQKRLRGLVSSLALVLIVALTVASAAAADTPGLLHRVLMRGQILEKENGTLVVCIGKQDGAQVGQELDVIRHVRTVANPKQHGKRFLRKEVGRVRITSLFDEHYATAELLDGSARVNDSVELIDK